MPLFIGGMFKSGTSLTRKFVGNHPDIFASLETNWFYLDQYFLNNSYNTNTIANQWSAFFNIEKELILKTIKLSNSSEEVLDCLMKIIIKKNNHKDWCEKSPPNISYGERIFNYWPNSKLIHIIRDPFDIFYSLKEAKKWDSPKEFTDRWISIFKHKKHLEKNSRYKEFRYEEIIKNTKKTLKNIFEFSELSWLDEYANHDNSDREYNLVSSITGKQSTTLKRLSKPITAARIGISKDKLSSEEKYKIKKLVDEKGLLDQFNSCIWKD
tara:strand:+ start:1658 stop:2461 length:804 start_codon:yes stop_codon:yes gene_type:complete